MINISVTMKIIHIDFRNLGKKEKLKNLIIVLYGMI